MSETGIIMFAILTVIKPSLCQFIHQLTTNEKSTICESTRDAKLVEHFFNLIFAEFHNTPPLCTCVQMCIDQPVYCYPSGCIQTKTKKSIHTHIQKENKRVTLVINDPDTAFLSNLFGDSEHVNTGIPEKTDNFLPGIPEDRYKTLVQYKRPPKVELRYNFRQHVNTKKSVMSNIGNAVVSTARWPNRHTSSKKLTAKINSADFISSVYSTPFINSSTRTKKNMKRENTEGSNLEEFYP